MNKIAAFTNRLFTEHISVPDTLQTRYLPSLDGLRAISILIVIGAHIINLNLNIKNTLLDGGLGVEIFFVISGFLITSLLLKEKIKTGDISLRHFYLRRALRIFPIAYLFILVTFLMNQYFNLGIPGSDFLSASFYYHNFGWDSFYLAHYWSLSVEEQFYLLFPVLLCYLNLRTYIGVCLGLLLISQGVVLMYPVTSDHLLPYNSILIGSLTSILLFKDLINTRLLNHKLCNNFLLIILIIITYKNHRQLGLDIIPIGIMKLINILLITILLIKNIYFKGDLFYRFLNLKPVKYLGLLSYSLYIWQQPFTGFQPWRNSFAYGGSTIFNLTALFIVAYLSYNYFEKPFLKLKEKFK